MRNEVGRVQSRFAYTKSNLRLRLSFGRQFMVAFVPVFIRNAISRRERKTHKTYPARQPVHPEIATESLQFLVGTYLQNKVKPLCCTVLPAPAPPYTVIAWGQNIGNIMAAIYHARRIERNRVVLYSTSTEPLKKYIYKSIFF